MSGKIPSLSDWSTLGIVSQQTLRIVKMCNSLRKKFRKLAG
jgi:hypothetical protein